MARRDTSGAAGSGRRTLVTGDGVDRESGEAAGNQGPVEEVREVLPPSPEEGDRPEIISRGADRQPGEGEDGGAGGRRRDPLQKALSERDQRRAEIVEAYRKKRAEEPNIGSVVRKVAPVVRTGEEDDETGEDGAEGAETAERGAQARQGQDQRQGAGRQTRQAPEGQRAAGGQQSGQQGERAEEPGEGGQPAAGTEKIALLVDGKVVYKSLADVIALAQQAESAHGMHEKAKRLLKDAEAKARGSQTAPGHQRAGLERADPGHQRGEAEDPETASDLSQDHRGNAAGNARQSQSPQSDRAGPGHQRDGGDAGKPTKGQLSRDRLKTVVERIQVGDTDEGIEAVEELVDLVREAAGAQLRPEDIDERVRQNALQMQQQAEINAAVAEFAQKYPTIANHKYLARAGVTALEEEIAKDLASAGLDQDDIAPLMGNIDALRDAHFALRAGGIRLRTPRELLDAAGRSISEEFGIEPAGAGNGQGNAQPAGQRNGQAGQENTQRHLPNGQAGAQNGGQRQQPQDRVERKRVLTTQPRAAGVRAPAPHAPRPRTALEIVEDMRRARGFAPTM